LQKPIVNYNQDGLGTISLHRNLIQPELIFRSNATYGIYNGTRADFPIGLRSWYMYATCDIVTTEPQLVQLKLAKVRVMHN